MNKVVNNFMNMGISNYNIISLNLTTWNVYLLNTLFKTYVLQKEILDRIINWKCGLNMYILLYPL